MKGIFRYVLVVMLTSDIMQNNSTSNVKKVRNPRLEHFESYSSFCHCTHSSAYRAFLVVIRPSTPSYWFLFSSSTTGPEHLIYRTMRIV